MRNLTYSSTIVEDGLALQLSQFKESNVRDLLTILLRQVQDLENAGAGSITMLYLANAVGWTLEQWGKLVGCPRPVYGLAATDDNVYRGLIYAQIAINNSRGRAADIYQIMGLINAQSVRVQDIYPAAIRVDFTGSPYINGEQIRATLRAALSPIELDIVHHEPDYFSLAGDPFGLGFGEGSLSTAY